MPRPKLGNGTDTLLFRRYADGENLHTFQWIGAWPPPLELTVVVEVATGQFKVIERVVQPASYQEWLEKAEKGEEYRVSDWVLNRASEIEEQAPKEANWFRGAEYLPK